MIVVGGGLAGLTAERGLITAARRSLVEARSPSAEASDVRDKGFDEIPLEDGGEFIDGAHAAFASSSRISAAGKQ